MDGIRARRVNASGRGPFEADVFRLGVVAALLQTEQVGVAGADAVKNEGFVIFPAIDAVLRQPVADVEGHEVRMGSFR